MFEYGYGGEYNPYLPHHDQSVFGGSAYSDLSMALAMHCLVKVVELLQEASSHVSPRVSHLAYRHKDPRVRKKNLKRMGIWFADDIDDE